MIRTLFVIVWIVFVTGIFSFIAILASLIGKRGQAPHKVARVWARSILAAAQVKVTVKGLSNLDLSRSYIYMSNHQSNFDIPVLLAYLTVQFRWLAKAELFRIPIFGFAMQRAGYISIDRSNRKSAILSLQRAAEIISGGVSVLIFPEGTRSRDGNIRSFKKGGFVLAIDSGVPIVPVIIHGTWPIMSKERLLIKPGKVVLEIGKPVETLNYTR
ncbi:lysophospholipid acyltransferase family protein, partial [Thermodesulfobacteriota bacterium]